MKAFDYSKMSSQELQQERRRIVKRLMADGAPSDPMERLACFEQRMCDPTNPITQELVQVDRVLRRKTQVSQR